MRIPENHSLIYNFLEKVEGPMSAEEIKFELHSAKIGIATIYRALNRGVEIGKLKEIDFPSGGKRYESKGLSHHHHFICDACDKAYDIPGCPKSIEKLLPKGFVLTGHEIYLYGQCVNCSST
jgi:Fur family transcriptional regulator, ferric uptake regulator